MKKKILITLSIVTLLTIVGYFGLRFSVGFVFDKYVFESAIQSVVTQEGDKKQEQQNGETNIEKPKETKQPEDTTPVIAPRKLSDSEVLAKVMSSSELTNKMASMVSYEDKRKVIGIVMSNFSADELTEIAKNVSQGMPAGYKSKMIGIAQSRLTGSQWNECMSLAKKYISNIRPYVE